MKTSYSKRINGVVNAPFITLPFDVDLDLEWLEVAILFTVKGWYSLLIWDPNRELRAQSLLISEPKTIMISTCPTEASFASVPGKIAQGKWQLEILTPTYSENHTYKIQSHGGPSRGVTEKNEEFNCWATVGSTKGFELNQYLKEKVYNTEKRWYKGDFHTHTTESDGKMTPVAGMEQAKKMKLDFFIATDHNIIPTKWINDQVMVVPGVEITSSKGHFNALGLTKWIDWRPSCADGGMETEEGMNRVISEVRDAGAIVSINHPMLKPWEWQFHETRLSDIDIVEIWNDPTYKDNPVATEQALHLWNTLWNDGYRIYGIGGSDSHLLPSESYEEGGPPSIIGDPATYVYCEGLSHNSLMEGVKQGKTYVSRGPEYELTIIIDGISYSPGSNLSVCFGPRDEIIINYELMPRNPPENANLYWIKDGNRLKEQRITNGERIQEQFLWKKEETTWLRFEVRLQDGTLLSFVNPIYNGIKTPKIKTWRDLLIASKYLY